MTAANATTAPGVNRSRRTPGRRDDRATTRPRSSSAERALARRRKRLETERAVIAAGGVARESSAERALRRHRSGDTPRRVSQVPSQLALQARRIPFVLIVIGLVCGGLAVTLWLSTGSAENSYDLSEREAINEALAERRAELERDVKAGQSAPGLADRAAELGMIPAGTIPVLVAAPDGAITVVGDPAPVVGEPKPPLNPPAPRPNQATGGSTGAPTNGNSGAVRGSGEQLVTMNSGTTPVANVAPSGSQSEPEPGAPEADQ